MSQLLHVFSLPRGARMRLGGEDFLPRLHRFVAVYSLELAGRRSDIERVDLRYESGIAVAFRESPPVAGL